MAFNNEPFINKTINAKTIASLLPLENYQKVSENTNLKYERGDEGEITIEFTDGTSGICRIHVMIYELT